MKSKSLSSLGLLAGICLTLGSCLNDNSITPYQRQQEDIIKIDKYLLNNPPNPNDIIIRDANSGIRLVITEQGTGIIPPTPENIIQVAYIGRLLSKGEVINPPFDQDDAYTFTLTQADAGGSDVISGWKHALAMMTEGTKATVYIPSGLAYGPNGSGSSIPDNAILVFDLELKIVNTENEEPQLTNDSTAISVHLDETAVPNVQVDPSGLHYVIEDIGTGPTPGLYDHVRIRYTGKIMDANETVFADNIEQGPVNIFSSRVVNYIHGLTIGLQKMNEGGKATFYMPSALGYGPTVNGIIPANSRLIFEVELLEVIPNIE
jgi:FKBP-type peptidyl-prolyl cis-trans isomerase